MNKKLNMLVFGFIALGMLLAVGGAGIWAGLVVTVTVQENVADMYAGCISPYESVNNLTQPIILELPADGRRLGYDGRGVTLGDAKNGWGWGYLTKSESGNWLLTSNLPNKPGETVEVLLGSLSPGCIVKFNTWL